MSKNRGARVLIYRLGSLGDTVVALPSFHLIAKQFAQAERRVLTNFPVATKAAPLESVLSDSGLVHGYFRYPVGSRNVAELADVMRKIRAWGPDTLIYLASPRGRSKAIRDWLFFKACGISRFVGVPFSADLQHRRYWPETGLYESEAERLARCVAPLGDADLGSDASWDLCFSPNEYSQADGFLDGWAGKDNFIAASLGTKVTTKDWGVDNWKAMLAGLSRAHPQLGLLMLGAPEEAPLSDLAASDWIGPVMNLCGTTSPRVSAAIMRKARIFIGHDSGPMHLAASVGTRCVVVFSARNRPGEWFPRGAGHKVIYQKTECFGCELDVCTEHQKKCLTSITIARVLQEVLHVLASERCDDAATVKELKGAAWNM